MRTMAKLLGILALAIVAATLLAAVVNAAGPNPCTALTFKFTRDSVYAELQAPRGTTVCERVVLR